MEDKQTAVGQNTGSPAPEIQVPDTAISPDTEPNNDSANASTATQSNQPKRTYTKEEVDAENNRVVNKKLAEIYRDLGTKDIKALGKLVRALQENPDGVLEAYRKGRGGAQSQTAVQPDPRYQQLEQTVYNLSLSQQIKDLAEEFPRVKNQEHLAAVLEFAQENQVDLRTAYLHTFYKQDIEDAEKRTVASIKQRRHLFLESGDGGISPEDEDLLSGMPDGWTEMADQLIALGEYKSRKDFAKSYKSKQKKG